MPGNYERDHVAGSHQFRNPLDDLESIAQSDSNYYSHNTSNHSGYNLNQNIPVGNLLDDFEIINTPGCSLDEQFVDLGRNGTKSYTTRRDEELIVALLTRTVNGIKFDKRNGEYTRGRTVQIPPGEMLREMADDDWKMIELKDWRMEQGRKQEGIARPMEDLSCDPTMCTMITSSDVMRISQEQAIHLLSVPVLDRLDLYKDMERLNFIVNLKVGDQVSVDVGEKMRRVPAKVSWIGERPPDAGIWYNVEFDTSPQWSQHHSFHDRLNHTFDNHWNLDMSGSSVASANQRLFYSPNQLHMPMKGGGVTTTLYDNRRPVQFNGDDSYLAPPKSLPRERIIPVTRHVEPERQSRTMRHPEPDYHAYQTHQNSTLPPPSTSLSAYQNSNQPSRSKSVHAIPNIHQRSRAADQNEAVDSDKLGFRVGDPCIWNNNGVEERGTIKYIGFLKGHKALYAGVEFKNRIGAGTGVFNKEQLFHSRDGHAGFVELSTLDSPSSTTSSGSNSSQQQHRRRLSSSRSQQMPAAAGTSISLPVNGRNNGKQASIESLSDPPPPPYAPPSPPRASSAAAAHQQPPPIPPKPIAHVEDYLINSYDPGSHVVVSHLGAQRSGVVRWLGDEMDEQGERLVRSAIVELNEDVPTAWRRSKEATSYQGSPIIGGVLVPVQVLHHNRAVANGTAAVTTSSQYGSTPPMGGTMSRRTDEFGNMDSGIEKNKCGPAREVQQLVGRMKGIQGYCNSCYLDATLYAMFAQTTFFDFLLEKSIKGSEKAALFQKILAQEIVFPLRKFHYVRADHVMKLRKLLADLMPHVLGLTSEEKDPEEILGFIFAKIFNAEPFIKLLGPNNSKDSQFLVPIVVDDWQGGAATSQHLLERHMRSAQVIFAKPPPVIILQLPRYGQQKVFDKILPLESIDITPFVAGAVPMCASCNACAEVFCPTCFLTRRVFFTDVVVCNKCFFHSHNLPEIEDHESEKLPSSGKQHKKPNSHKMVLSAVLCIETSHYVAFVRTAANQWLFFDSMADREGLSDGFNVPVVRECGNMSDWLSLQGWHRLKDADETGQIKAMFGKSALDPLVGRLLSDSYICFYEEANSSSPSTTANIISTFKNMMN